MTYHTATDKNIIFELRDKLLLCKNQASFDEYVERFFMAMEFRRKYNLQSFFSDKQVKWRKKLYETIIQWCMYQNDNRWYIEVNDGYDENNFIFIKKRH